jgi:L-rhamnose mutarotase
VKRVCFLLQVRPERLDEYVNRHGEVWEEMLEALRESGWSNYTLFHREDGLVVGYLETESFEAALAAMEGRDVNARWQAEMAPFFDLGDRRPDQAMAPLTEFFHLA